jgi:hypothetical protein
MKSTEPAKKPSVRPATRPEGGLPRSFQPEPEAPVTDQGTRYAFYFLMGTLVLTLLYYVSLPFLV